MKGWFDAFRNDGGPTLYTYSNRTPVTGDVNTISIILVFSTLLVAFLVIFPGIRKEERKTIPRWLAGGKTFLFPISGDLAKLENNRPNTYLNIVYKIFTRPNRSHLGHRTHKVVNLFFVDDLKSFAFNVASLREALEEVRKAQFCGCRNKVLTGEVDGREDLALVNGSIIRRIWRDLGFGQRGMQNSADVETPLQRFTTFLSVILSLYIGTVILAANHGSSWHVGVTNIVSTYRAYSSDRLHAELGAYIGLTHVNVTLRALPGNNKTEDIDFNERFQWIGSNEMGTSYKQSLKKGLPFPILTVAEYLSQCQEGFNWGAHYRAAGYYAGVTLWAAFASWLMMNLLLIVVPRYGAYAMTTTGTLMLLTGFLYWYMIPPHELIVRLENSVLNFHFGNCFYLVLYSGILCVLVGLIITIIDTIFPHKFSTILEVDYDTPYDRHIIIEDSHVTKAKKKEATKIEEPIVTGFGNKILRRLSKRGVSDGVGNEAFEMDPPKSPWRYPFRQTAFPEFNGDTTAPSQRRDVATETGLVKSHINMSRPPMRVPKYPFNRQISADSQESDHSGSSLGLSFLSKIRDSQRVPQSPLATQTPGIHDSRRSLNQRSDVW